MQAARAYATVRAMRKELLSVKEKVKFVWMVKPQVARAKASLFAWFVHHEGVSSYFDDGGFGLLGDFCGDLFGFAFG